MRIKASARLKSHYRDLLGGDGSEQSLQEAISLNRQLLESVDSKLVFPWETPPQKPSAPRLYPIPPAASPELRQFLEGVNASMKRPVTGEAIDRHVGERNNLARCAVEAAVLLMAEWHFHPKGDTHVLRDLQSLLFLECARVLVPRLGKAGLTDEVNHVLHALRAHATLFWTDDPAHQQYLLHVFFDLVGDKQSAKRLLWASLQATDVEAHEYLSKAQSFWSLLMEEGDYEEAQRFVLGLYRRGREEDLAEIREWVDMTYAASRRDRDIA